MEQKSYLLEIFRGELKPKNFGSFAVSIVQLKAEQITRINNLWFKVGEGFWSEREDWNEDRWVKHLSHTNTHFYAATCGGADIGFFELLADKGEIKIEGFGLLPKWRGKGIGGGLLTAATNTAFEKGAARVWLHTATDDHQNALPNYKKRGYRVYHEEALENPMHTPIP